MYTSYAPAADFYDSPTPGVRLIFCITWLTWLGLSIIFCLDRASYLIPYAGTACLISSALLIFGWPRLGLYLLPLAMMLGPIFHLTSAVGMITIGDLYAFLLILRSLLIQKQPSRTGSGYLFMALGIVLIGISSIMSESLSSSLAGIGKIFEYGLLYRTTRLLTRNQSDVDKTLKMWVATTTVCALMILWQFYVNQTFMIYFFMDAGPNFRPDFNSSDVFFRPSFFYANFWIPLGLTVVYCVAVLVLEGFRHSLRTKLLLIVAGCISFVALLVNNTKSMLFPVVGISSVLLLFWMWRLIISVRVWRLLVIVPLVILAIGIGRIATDAVGIDQLVAMEGRLIGTESFEARLVIWANVLDKLTSEPVRLCFGYGPQATTRQTDEPAIEEMLNGREGAFDSTPVGLIVEHGLIFTLLLFVSICLWFGRAWNCYRLRRDRYALLLLLMFFTIVVSHFSQQFGLNPPALMVLQVFALLSPLTWFNTISRQAHRG